MPIFECFSVFFCVYIRKCLIFSEKKVVFLLKIILKSVAQFKKMLYLYNVKEKQILTIKTKRL